MKDSAPRKLLPEERLTQMAALVAERQAISVAELGERFEVSLATVRTDLDELERRGLVLRTHGGAVHVPRHRSELSLQVRERSQVDEKRRIGAAAAALIHDGDTIALDASTTALSIARHVRERRELTVMTCSLVVALELIDSPGITVVMPGGILHRDTVSLVGSLGAEIIAKCNAGKGFFGVRGLTPDAITDTNTFETEIKRLMIGVCREVTIVADASKWGRVALTSLVPWSAVHRVITDRQAPAEMVAILRQRGIEVMLT